MKKGNGNKEEKDKKKRKAEKEKKGRKGRWKVLSEVLETGFLT